MKTDAADGITRVRTPAQIAAVTALVWEFFDFLRARYPEMQAEIDRYIADQDVAGRLADFSANYAPPAGECFLASRDGIPVGIVMLRPAGDGTGEVNRMYVREAARGGGFGRRLCAAIIAEARALGYAALTLSALHRHVEALPLYESLGFKRYRKHDALEGDDPRFIHMRLDL